MTDVHQTPALEGRALGCLVGLAVGNVLGLSVESRSREDVHSRLGAFGPFTRLPTQERNREWDDDLAMAMALAEILLQHDPEAEHLDSTSILEAYLAWLRTGSRGIGSLTREVLIKAQAGEANAAERVWKARCDRGQPALGNGAAMRIAPLGVAFADEPQRIPQFAAEDAALTHWDPICRQTAAMIALLTAALVRGERAPLTFARLMAGPLLPEVIEAFIPLSLDRLAEQRIDGWNMGSTLLALQIAVSVLASGMPYGEALPWVIRQGGDTDTNGAIVGALLGARDGIAAIPQEWRDCVAEEGRILHMGRRLLLRTGLVPAMGRP
jgi:ADP-ribosyl-[dinitrogen reductase] hydrolase